MTLSDKEREKFKEYLSSLPDDELAGIVETASQSARFNPDVKEKRMVGVQYARGTRAGREKYAQDKEAAKDALDEIGSFVSAEKTKRSEKYRADRVEPNRAANREGIFGIRDDPDEEGLTMQEVVERRIEEQNAVAASDDNQLQRELGGINPEAMETARADRDRASQRSLERGVRNSTARLDREAEARFAQAEQELTDADAARMREGEEAFAAESDRQRRASRRLERGVRNSTARLDREAEARFAQAEQELADADAARMREGEEAFAAESDRQRRASQMPEERRAMNERAAEQGQDLQEEAMSLFPKIMGSSFDPNSSMDKGKLEIIMKARADFPDLSPNQLALKIYKDYM